MFILKKTYNKNLNTAFENGKREGYTEGMEVQKQLAYFEKKKKKVLKKMVKKVSLRDQIILQKIQYTKARNRAYYLKHVKGKIAKGYYSIDSLGRKISNITGRPLRHKSK